MNKSILVEKVKKKLNGMMAYYALVGRGLVMMYGFILRFRIQDEMNSAYELLKKKSSSFTLKKFINPANVRHRFTLVIECTEQDVVEFMQNYLPQFYSGDIDISLLHGNESEIDKMKPI